MSSRNATKDGVKRKLADSKSTLSAGYLNKMPSPTGLVFTGFKFQSAYLFELGAGCAEDGFYIFLYIEGCWYQPCKCVIQYVVSFNAAVAPSGIAIYNGGVC